MHPAIKAIKNALVHATFKDQGIKDCTNDLLRELGEDLDATNSDYEEPEQVSNAIESLESAINEYEVQNEAIKDVIGTAKTVEEDDASD